MFCLILTGFWYFNLKLFRMFSSIYFLMLCKFYWQTSTGFSFDSCILRLLSLRAVQSLKTLRLSLESTLVRHLCPQGFLKSFHFLTSFAGGFLPLIDQKSLTKPLEKKKKIVAIWISFKYSVCFLSSNLKCALCLFVALVYVCYMHACLYTLDYFIWL